jgi:uncharacterized protein (TIGR02687 family)
MSKVQENLQRLFEKYRVIIWYDGDKHFTERIEELELNGASKQIIRNNEFAIKYNILVQHPEAKFLIYAPYSRPADDENWLLDIELANHVFSTDQEAMILQDLELPYHFRGWVQNHIEFFNSKERTQRFKNTIELRDSEPYLTSIMLQLVIGSGGNTLDDHLKAYSAAFINNKQEAIDNDLVRFGLKSEFWEQVRHTYGYNAKEPSIYDFLLEIFQKNFTPTASKAQVNRSTDVLLSSWKDTRSFEKTFQDIAERIEKDLMIEGITSSLTMDQLINEDVFEHVDRDIISELSQQIISETMNLEKVDSLIKIRESKYWFFKYKPFYESLRYAAWLIEDVGRNKKIKIDSYQDGIKNYTEQWYLIDKYYRLFLQYYRETNQNNVLNTLYQKINKVYSNTWLLELSDRWQEVIDKTGRWYDGGQKQSDFFKRDVKPYIDKSYTVFVVISDALRYECGEAIHELFTSEVRFTSRLSYQVTNLPSYTQLGMASLLPHTSLSFGEGGDVLVDGKSTKGEAPRKKILEENAGVRATTILAEDLMRMASKSDEARALTKNHDLVYVYHNRIDKLGDDKTQEDKVIEASKTEIEFLVEVVKKITNMHIYHVLLTSDHGFIYQNEVLQESDFSDAQVEGDVAKYNRRFVLGTDLTANNTVVKYKAKELGIKSEVDVFIPKGINRLRVQGAGSRFVHGGATLQEVVTPVLFIAKKKSDTVAKVDIDILNKTNNRITTNIHQVKFYQQQPVGDGVIERSIKASFAVVNGDDLGDRQVISDVFNYTFDSASKRSEEREVQKKFTLSTNIKKSQNVYLLVEEKVEASNKWNVILKYPYTLNLAMENDFDDF